MPESPQVESGSTLTIDFQDSPKLKQVFQQKDVGDYCEFTVKVCITSKYPEGVQAQIEKITTDEYDERSNGENPGDIEPDEKEPVMMRMRAKKQKTRGMDGPHAPDKRGGPSSRPAETARNSAEPWMTSYT